MDNSITTARGKYFIVSNLTGTTQVIVPGRRDMAGQDLVIPPFGYVEVDDGEKWERDRNLEKARNAGRVKNEWLDERPPLVPTMPTNNAIRSNSLLANMVHSIVFADDKLARDLITAEPRLIGRVGQPIDRDWMKGTGWEVLKAAKDWLLVWGPPPEKKWRVELIDERLEFIRGLP